MVQNNFSPTKVKLDIMQTALHSIILLLVYLFCASSRPLWPFSAVASVEAAEREVVTAALQNHHEIPIVESNRNMITNLVSSWFGGAERPLTSANRLENSAHSTAAEASRGITSTENNDAVRMAPSLVERLPENGRRTIDTIKSLIETIITTIKTVIRDIKNKYQDIKDIYRLFYPLPPRETLPPVERPNTLVGNLQKMWDNRPTPVKNANIVMQRKIMATRADALIQTRLKWLPNSLKPKTRQWMIDNAPWLFDALCNGKTHTNPRIQQLAAEIQLKITKANPSVNNMVIEAICLFKKSPI